MTWQELKRFDKAERCKILIKEYLGCKSFRVMAKRYYVTYRAITNLIESNRPSISDDLEAQELYKKMDELKIENMKNRKKRIAQEKIELGKDDNTDEFKILETLPKKISYLSFLDIVAGVSYSKASTDDWLNAAETKGIKVIN